MTGDIAALERHLRRNPGDWASWLVFADWLTDHGDPRGACIVHTHALEVLRPSRDQRAIHRAALDAANVRRRGPPEAGWPARVRWTWRFGFVIGVALPWDADTLQALARLHTHALGRLWSQLTLAVPDVAALDALLASPATSTVCELDLGSGRLGDVGAERLAASPSVRELVWLRLAGNEIRADGVAALAASPHLAELVELDLSFNPLHGGGVRALDGPGLPRLRRLVVRHCALWPDDRARLAEIATRRGWTVLVEHGAIPRRP